MFNPMTVKAAFCALALSATAAIAADKPNIVLIVADDLGYTDISATGSEIATPHIDSLAHEGNLFSDFVVASSCSPTRAMLMSGTDNHLAGLGLMAEMPKAPNQRDQPGYLGYLNDQVYTFPATLQDAGYRTYMAGKWHLGKEDGQRPESKGFDQSFTMMEGGASHFSDMEGIFPRAPAHYFENGTRVTALPEDFFSSDFYTDLMIDYIGTDTEQPFFAYLAYTAPHWPLQAPEQWITPFKGKYDAGYEVLKQQRTAALIEKGLFPSDMPINGFEEIGAHKPWASLTDQERAASARSMEIYAGMVANLDWNIGRLIAHLKEIGAYDNTVILFMSDNGAEAGNIKFIWDFYPDAVKKAFLDRFDTSFEEMGKSKSFVFYDEWGQAGVGPYRAYKGSAAQGGVKTFLLAKPATGALVPAVNHSLVSVMDIAPTLLELAGASHPASVNGRDVLPHKGKSLTSILNGQTTAVRDETDIVGTDLFFNSGLRKGDWRIVRDRREPYSNEEWMLFDLKNDPAEVHDVAQENPEKLQEMLAAWEVYVAENNLIFPQR